jgi:cell division protein FtsB
MSNLAAHFALLKELEQENQEIETTIADLMDEMARVPPDQRSAGEWGPSGTQTKRFIELSERQNEIAAEIKLVSAAIESAKPAGKAN